jgi:hypothetical protein
LRCCFDFAQGTVALRAIANLIEWTADCKLGTQYRAQQPTAGIHRPGDAREFVYV